MSSFGRRLAITLLIPVALVLFGGLILIPTVPSELATGFFGDQAFGIFALGIRPILSATWLVELVAILVPALHPLRRGDRAGRAKLERASLVVGLGFALVQTYGMVLALLQITRGSSQSISIPIVAATLLGGTCVALAAAALVTRQGLMNGFVLVLGFDALTAFIIQIRIHFFARPFAHQEGIAGVFGILAIFLASWGLLRGAGRIAGLASATTREGPYRDSRNAAMARSIPLPASSLQVVVVVAALVSTVTTLTGWEAPLGPTAATEEKGTPLLVASIALTGIVILVLTWLMHRPQELADVAARFENVPREAIVTELRQARKDALVPTFLFFAVLLVAGAITRVMAFNIVVLVAIALDLAHSLGLAKSDDSRVVVWEERRAAAVPILRAALASDGIPSEVRGMAYLSTFQIFAPYAPAQISVPREDETRALAIAHHLALGEAAPAPIAAPAPLPPQKAPWSIGRRSAIVGAALLAALGALAFGGGPLDHRAKWTTRAPPRSGPRAALAISWVDDAVDPLATIAADRIPEADGIHLYTENLHGRVIHYVKIDGLKGPTQETPLDDARRFMSTVPLPPARRFAIGDMSERDPDSGMWVTTGLRSYLLAGEPFIRTEDIAEATAMPAAKGELPYIAITLSNAGAARLEVETRRGVGKRLAIEVEGRVAVAPVVRSAIPGGHVSLMLTTDEPEIMLARAKELAVRLNP